jgi:short-subunit dehydrogenase
VILRGWRDICKAAGGISENVARRLTQENAFPVVFIAGSPQTTTALLEGWVEKHVKQKIGVLDLTEPHQAALSENTKNP